MDSNVYIGCLHLDTSSFLQVEAFEGRMSPASAVFIALIPWHIRPYLGNRVDDSGCS